MIRRGRWALLGLVLALYQAGCDSSVPGARLAASQPVEGNPVLSPVVDESERTSPPMRIVSAAPNITEICCALGLRDELVGRTDYCVYPPGIEQVESIGSLIKVNAEALLALRAELVLVSGASRFQTERLEALHIPFVSTPDTRLDDLYEAITIIGGRTGRPRTAAALCERLKREIEAALREGEAARGVRALVTLGVMSDPPRPPFVAGPGSFYDDILSRAGVVNVAAGVDSAFSQLSLEYIVRADPDVIIELDDDSGARPLGDADALAAWARVPGLTAVSRGRVHTLTGGRHYRLGPRLPVTIRALLQAASPKP